MSTMRRLSVFELLQKDGVLRYGMVGSGRITRTDITTSEVFKDIIFNDIKHDLDYAVLVPRRLRYASWNGGLLEDVFI